MSLMRPVFITRRFWPRSDGAGRAIAELAACLAQRGATCTVLAAADRPGWPATVQCRGAAVERIAPPPRDCRSEIRFARALAQWLRANRGRYDVVCVSSLRHDALTTLRAVGRDAPVVLRAERAGPTGDCYWQIGSRRGGQIKKACMNAAALVGVGARTRDELVAAGYPRKRIHAIPHGVAARPPRTEATRADARRALAESDPALAVPLDAPLVLHAGRLDTLARLDVLLTAFGAVARRRPAARLWLAGDGPARAALAQRLRDDPSGGNVAALGVFDSIDLLLDAADAFVLPSPDADLPLALLEAMAAGVPVAACDAPGNREAMRDGRHGLLFPPGGADALAAAIERLLDQPDLAQRLGAAARARAADAFSLEAMADAYATLFQQLAAG
ncbi:MAG: glycosyltransferase family 4 protein [Pirellulales bacterium]|nr:glycosyltransferase family 4 protein [Pirellulales bacterium]